MILSKEAILAADDMGLLEVDVPEWSGSVYIRCMTVAARDAYENDWVQNKHKGVENFRTKFLQKVLCDATGALLFTEQEMASLGGKSARVMNRLWTMAMKHNALTEADVEQLAKN